MSSPRSVMIEDASPGDEIRRYPPALEIGRTGLRRSSGYVQEEFLPQLRGRKLVQVMREMADNSSVISGFVRAVEYLIRQIEWRVEPASNSSTHRADAQFVEECKDDMSHSWGDMISEIMSMIVFGWDVQEIVYKKRVGPWENDGARRSKYTDGRIGWRKIATRSQESLLRWVFDETGGIRAMVQQPAPAYHKIVLPIERILLFRVSSAKNNPEGKSLLRGAYQSWWYLKRHQEIEAVGVERDLTGLPIAFVPSAMLAASPNSEEGKMLQAIKDAVKSVRRNENEGLVWPQELDRDAKTPKYDFKLMTSGGSRQFDTESIINRYKTEMLQSVLADFMQVGHEDNGGSYALHTDKTGMFRTALNAIAQSIADVFNRHAIPRLFAINGMKPDELPKIVPNDVDPPNLGELAQFMTATGGLGMPWFPDPSMEKFVRDIARVPQLDKDIEEIREVEQRQAAIIGLAQQRLQAIQMEQQAAQGQMSVQQQALGVQQQSQQLQAGPSGPSGQDPSEAKRGQLAVQTDRVKLDQEKAKLTNLKQQGGARARQPVKKSLSGFGVDHELVGVA